MGRDAVWQREVVIAERRVSHSCVVDKNQEGYLGSKGYLGSEQSQPQARPHSPEFQL